jgi:ribosomal protein L37AE/L43A
MHNETCPRCGNSKTVQRIVNDRFRACDAAGRVFEVSLQAPIWSCPACRMGWEGQEALAAKESAYLAALTKRAVETRSR